MAGELKVAAYADLGGLGTRQGPPARFVWTMPNLLPVLLPWVAVLALLALPSNRCGRAWLICIPLAVLAVPAVAVAEVWGGLYDDAPGYVAYTLAAVAFALTAVWLVGASISGLRRPFRLGLTVLVFAATALLATVVSPLWDHLWEIRRWEPAVPLYVIAFWVCGGLAYAGALNLTGWACRKRFSGPRFCLRLPVLLWGMWLLAGGILVGLVVLGSGGSFEWPGFVVGVSVVALISYGLVLPFLILSFTSSFYQDRLKSLARLAPAETPPPAGRLSGG